MMSTTTAHALTVCAELASVISTISTRLTDVDKSSRQSTYVETVVLPEVVVTCPSPREVRSKVGKRVRWAAILVSTESKASAWLREADPGPSSFKPGKSLDETELDERGQALVAARSEIFDLQFEREEECDALRTALDKQTALRERTERENARLRRQLARIRAAEPADEPTRACSVCGESSNSRLRRWACCSEHHVCAACLDSLLDDNGGITCQVCCRRYFACPAAATVAD